MYLVDTNILSEARRRSGSARTWMRGVDQSLVHLSVITLGEIQKGLELKAKRDPTGAQPLLDWLTSVRREHANRIISVSDEIALEWGRLEAQRPRGPDGLIAATALVHGLTLVTRNVADFQDVPVRLIDPWSIR